MTHDCSFHAAPYVHAGLETFSQLVYRNPLEEVRVSVCLTQSLILNPYSTPSIRLILMMLPDSSSVVP